MQQNKENRFSGMTREEIVLEARKQILHSALLALAALIVIGVACYAWFASNKSVTAQISAVSLNGDCFELASVGGEGRFDSEAPEEFRTEGDAWTYGSLSGTQTSNTSQSILWRMNSTSNIGNLNSRGRGISPGSRGTLEFYVIPKRNSDLSLDACLDIIPMKTGSQLDDTSPAWELLRGHLLFLCEYEEQGTTVRQLAEMADGHFQIAVPAGTQEMKVTIKWYWPYLLSHAIAYDEQVAEYVVDSLKEENPQYFFYGSGLDQYMGGKVTKDNLSRYMRRLSDFYNNADQFIGDNVDSIILRLRVEAK